MDFDANTVINIGFNFYLFISERDAGQGEKVCSSS